MGTKSWIDRFITLPCCVEEMVKGLIDADLGGHVYKKRIALPGKGKSGSVRTLLRFFP